MEEPAFLCQCRLVPETNEERLEKVTAIHGLSQSGPGNKLKPPSLLLPLQGPTINFFFFTEKKSQIVGVDRD